MSTAVAPVRLPPLLPLLYHDLVQRALLEDLGRAGDVTTDAIAPAGLTGRGLLVARQAGRIAGLDPALHAFRVLDPACRVEVEVADGHDAEAGQAIAAVEASARALLGAERTALNLLGHLSGIATATRQVVACLAGLPARVADTRKTTPGLRALEKYAVRCGGGRNHRAGLYDRVLVKENHLRLAGGVTAALATLDGRVDGLPVEIEAETLAQVREAIDGGAPRILLDNMSPEEVREAVEVTAGRAELEASGGVSLATVRAYAETGVEYVSVGALTHSARSLHVSLEVR